MQQLENANMQAAVAAIQREYPQKRANRLFSSSTAADGAYGEPRHRRARSPGSIACASATSIAHITIAYTLLHAILASRTPSEYKHASPRPNSAAASHRTAENC